MDGKLRFNNNFVLDIFEFGCKEGESSMLIITEYIIIFLLITSELPTSFFLKTRVRTNHGLSYPRHYRQGQGDKTHGD